MLRSERWRNQAACVGLPTKWFFPEGGGEAAFIEGKKVCKDCPVKEPCLLLADDFVATGDRYGLFGGLTPGERRLRRKIEVNRFLWREDGRTKR